jgi:hypothetical protein
LREMLLYSTLGCHLCELAEDALMPWLLPYSLRVSLVDIAEENLIADYGERIPVLQDVVSQACLDWPFDTAAVGVFLESLGAAT